MTAFATLVRASVVSIAICASQPAIAQCSGFTDVAQGHALCPNVDWLRNRAITLGCTSPTLYCPGDSVIRLTMAAFMNRLGNALTPQLDVLKNSGSALPLASSTIVCIDSVPGNAYPQSLSVIGVVNAQVAAAVGASMSIVFRPEGAPSWTTATQAPQSLAGGAGWINGAVQKSAIPLDAGINYNVAIQLDPLPGTAPLGPWSCQIKTKAASRTGTGFPY